MIKIHNKLYIILILLWIFLVGCNFSTFTARADELSTNIQEQINNLDLKDLENFFNINSTIWTNVAIIKIKQIVSKYSIFNGFKT